MKINGIKAYNAIICTVYLLPFLLICSFPALKYDDSTFNAYKNLGYWKGLGEWFSKENGRYFFAMLSLLPKTTYWYIYKCTPLLLTFSLYFSSLSLFQQVDTEKNIRRFFALFMVAIIIFNHPCADEGFFWLPTSFHYILGPILILVLITRLVRGYLNKNNKHHTLLNSLLIFCITGTNEINGLCLLTGLTLFFLYKVIIRQFKKEMVIYLLVNILGLILSFLLLKNSRIEHRGMRIDFSLGHVYDSLINGLGMMLQEATNWLLSNGLFMIPLLILILITPTKLKLKLPFIPTLLICFCINWVAFFMCNISFFVPRILNNNFLLFVFSLVFLSFSAKTQFQIPAILNNKAKHLVIIVCLPLILVFGKNTSFYSEAKVTPFYWFPKGVFESPDKTWQVHQVHPHLSVAYHQESSFLIYRYNRAYLDWKSLIVSIKPDRYYSQNFYPKDQNYRHTYNSSNGYSYYKHKITIGPKRDGWNSLQLSIIQKGDTLSTRILDY